MAKFNLLAPAQDGLGILARLAKHAAESVTTTPETSLDNVVQATTATAVPMVIKRASSGATADLLQIQDETGSVLSGFSSSGSVLGGSLSAISLFGVKDSAYGAKGDYTHFTSAGVNINDGAMTSGSPTLACTTTTPFKAADVGKAIFVPTAGSAGGTLVSTISAFVDSGHVTLAANASASVSAQTISYGTDDTAAIQAAITACAAAGGGTVFFPAGRYYTAELAVSGRGVNLEGVGLGDTGSGGYGTMLVGSSALVTDLVTVSADKCSIQRMTLSGNSYGRDVLRLTNAATRFFGDDI